MYSKKMPSRQILSLTHDLALVAKMMGHTNIQTTCRYINEVPKYCQEAADKLGESLKEILSINAGEVENRKKVATKVATEKTDEETEKAEICENH